VVRIETFSDAHLDEVVALCAAEGWPSWTDQRVGRAFSAPGVLALVALEEDAVLGVAELLTDGEVIAYLGLLVVSQQARRRGTGRALIRELFTRSGLPRIDLLSETDSVSFYEAFPHKTKPGYRLYDNT
jgi:ribosomal protein S18 acetylase RimI-like enzyme